MSNNSSSVEEDAIVIVGGGISGLATALALHRKGLKVNILERAQSLRSEGAAIAIHSNGWRALDQLGVGTLLRQNSIRIEMSTDVFLDNGTKQQILVGKEELRCLKRSDLLETLADALPSGTIRFGCRVIDIKIASSSTYPSVMLQDGSTIKAKVLIGCDGVNSIVAHSLGLKSPKLLSIISARGLTFYPEGQPLGHHFIRLHKNKIVAGRIPINSNLVHWFIGWPCLPKDSQTPRDPKLIREAIEEIVKDFPSEIIEMVKNSEPESLSVTRLRYRSPWELLLASFSKGRVTVAGDSMHVIGPFLGQGGCTSLEDAVVLSRFLARQADGTWDREMPQLRKEIDFVLQSYVKERRMRLVRLATHCYLMGKLQCSWFPLNLVLLLVINSFFGSPLSYSQYDCGSL